MPPSSSGREHSREGRVTRGPPLRSPPARHQGCAGTRHRKQGLGAASSPETRGRARCAHTYTREDTRVTRSYTQPRACACWAVPARPGLIPALQLASRDFPGCSRRPWLPGRGSGVQAGAALWTPQRGRCPFSPSPLQPTTLLTGSPWREQSRLTIVHFSHSCLICS